MTCNVFSGTLNPTQSIIPYSAVKFGRCLIDSRESSTTRCYILTDEQYLCSDKSAIFFEPTAGERVTSTGSADDVEDAAAGGSQRGDGYIQLTR